MTRREKTLESTINYPTDAPHNGQYSLNLMIIKYKICISRGLLIICCIYLPFILDCSQQFNH